MEIPRFFQTDSLLSQHLNILEFWIFKYKKDRITSTPKSKIMTQKKEKLVHRNSMISVLYYMYQRKPVNMEKNTNENKTKKTLL